MREFRILTTLYTISDKTVKSESFFYLFYFTLVVPVKFTEVVFKPDFLRIISDKFAKNVLVLFQKFSEILRSVAGIFE